MMGRILLWGAKVSACCWGRRGEADLVGVTLMPFPCSGMISQTLLTNSRRIV